MGNNHDGRHNNNAGNYQAGASLPNNTITITGANGQPFSFEKPDVNDIVSNVISISQKQIRELQGDISQANKEGGNKEVTKMVIAQMNHRIEQLNEGIVHARELNGSMAVAELQGKFSAMNEEIKGAFALAIAQTQKDAARLQIQANQAQQDPNQISQTEMDVFNIIKKYDFLKDPEAYKNLVNTSTDKDIKADALSLEKSLKKLGAHLQVDGKIDQNTIDAVESVISKNVPAIKAYEEVTGINPIKPSAGGSKPIQNEGKY